MNKRECGQNERGFLKSLIMKDERSRGEGMEKETEAETNAQRKRNRVFTKYLNISYAKWWSRPLHTENLGTLTSMRASQLYFVFFSY